MSEMTMLRQSKPYHVPRTCAELRRSLGRMGVKRINGRPLARIRKRQLYAVFFKVRDATWDGPREW